MLAARAQRVPALNVRKLTLAFTVALVGGLVCVPVPAFGGDEKKADEPQPAPAVSAPAVSVPAVSVWARTIEAARIARPSVVRIVWQSYQNRDDVRERNAIVVSAAGHLLMAGPAPDRERGRLTAEILDLAAEVSSGHAKTMTVRATFVAHDPGSALTLLYVSAPGLQPIAHPPAPLPAQVVPIDASTAADEVVATDAVGTSSDRPADASPVVVQGRPDALSEKRPLGTLALGTSVVLVSGDGGVACGTVRARDRKIRVRDPGTGHLLTVSPLVEATLTSLPSDLGAPWVDDGGRLLALQMATGLARSIPEDDARARAHGLILRPRPTASRAVPVSVIRAVLPLLMRRRFVRRGSIGADTRMATEAVRAHFCDDGGCFEVVSVAEGGPAARAGLRANDLIISIQGDRLRPTARFDDIVLPFRPGETIQLGLVREGRSKRVEVTLAGIR